MKHFIEFVAKSLLENPQDLSITETQENGENKIELFVSQTEIGKVIGKHGQMADALRTIVNFHSNKILKKPHTFRIIEKGQTHI